jgi:hypothetical protein
MGTMSINLSREKIVASRNHCKSLLSKVAAKSRMDPSHVLFRRECYRWAFQAPAAIRYQGADGNPAVLEATVEDLAATGMGLLCQEPLVVGLAAEVFVQADSRMYSAAVRITHTSLTTNGFRIGCEFEVRDDSEPST